MDDRKMDQRNMNPKITLNPNPLRMPARPGFSSRFSADPSNRLAKLLWAIGCGFVLIGIVATAELATAAEFAAAAGPTEPLPDYSDADSLRIDSSLVSVAFADPRSDAAGTGVAVGDRGAIYRSTDGGKTWRTAACVRDARSANRQFVDCRLEKVTWLGPSSVLVVGGSYDTLTQLSRGVVLISHDAGQRFTEIDQHDLPRLRSLTVQADRSVVAAGDWSHSQMTHRFVSRNGGRTWQGQSLRDDPGSKRGVAPEIASQQSAASFLAWTRLAGVHAPIRDVCRVSASRLCAVGDHGVILTSDDDGETWIAQRNQDCRAAILFITGDASAAPWSLLGTESLGWRNRCALLIDAPENDDEKATDLTRQAAMMLGCASVDYFANGHDPDQSEPTVHYGRQRDIQAKQWIAVHRPAVVVIDQSVAESTRQAVLRVAASMGVRRVLKADAKESGGSLLHQSAMLPRIGVLASDLTLDALQLIDPMHCAAASISVTRLYDAGGSRLGGGGESITAGLVVDAGARHLANAKPISRHRLQVVQARMKQAKLIDQLLNGSSDDPQRFRLALTAFLDQTAAEDQLRSAWTVFSQVRNDSIRDPLANRSRLENVCLQEIASRFDGQSIGAWAAVREQAFVASAEQRSLRATSLGLVAEQPASMVQPASVAVSPFQDLHAVAEMPRFAESNGFGSVRQASSMIPVGVGRPDVVSPAIREDVVQPVARVDLQMEFHPAVILSRTAKNRLQDAPVDRSAIQDFGKQPNASEPSSADGDLQRIADQGSPAWKRLFTEHLDTTRADSGRGGVARRTRKPPRLDGRLDDLCWDQSTPLMFADEPDASSMKLSVAFDDQYLYVAAQCPTDKIAADQIALGDGHAPNRAVRDQQLDNTARFKLCLDTDADLWTSHCIEVTDQGRTRDTIDGDPSWQPTWYVDVYRTDSTLTFEMAIDRKDIAADLELGLDSELGPRWFVHAAILQPGTQATQTLFPSPSGWRSLRFDPGGSQSVNRPALHKVPTGPVRLAPVRLKTDW